MDSDKFIDESWKNSVENEKVHIFGQEETEGQAPAQGDQGEELNFSNYVASLGFQALIFMGEIPNPVTEQPEKNLSQSKFLIDTLILLREKTKGNLTEQEDKLLNGAIYELQVKFMEVLKRENGGEITG
ncbi:MAG: DUF1844 domain-containing protein [Candidatus Omnitrophica bacterium]|nr:DUF1844 domain-containing protein [Candidatus Omnitrophota bacterium]